MTRLAYLVGNNNYQNWGQLQNPANDVLGISTVLENIGFMVRPFPNLNYADLSQCVYDFGQELNGFDVGLFYFAGHGVEFHGQNYLIPIDASNTNQERIILESVGLSGILNWMANYGDKTNIVILDACRTNISLGVTRGIITTGLLPVSVPRGTFISYSTSPGSTATDGIGENSFFAEALIRFLPSEGVKIEDVFKMVRYYVQEKSNGRQLTWELSALLGDFYFVEPRHSFSIEGITPQVIYDYAESIWDDYEGEFEANIAEALVFIRVSEYFNIPLLEVYRGYTIIQASRYSNFSDEQLCVMGLEHLIGIGFTEKNGRWYYDGNPVRMGEILPLPPDMEMMLPEEGREINATMNIAHYFDDDMLIIRGVGNMPPETLLMLSLRNLETGYFAQDSVHISDGAFTSNGFTNKGEKLSDGNYLLEITSPVFSVQPEVTKRYLGNRCRNLVGQYVEFNIIGGNTLHFIENLRVNDPR